MKQPLIRARLQIGSVVAAEAVAVTVALVLVMLGCSLPLAAAVGAATALLCCVLTASGLTAWQWAVLGARWMGQREHRLAVGDKRNQSDRKNVDVDG